MQQAPFTRSKAGIVLGVLGIGVLAIVLGGCRKSTPSSPSPSKAKPEVQDEAWRDQREKRAKLLYEVAKGTPLPEKIDKMKEIVHVYWDTEAGRSAFEQEILYLVHGGEDRPDEAIREVKFFERRNPEAWELLNGTGILCNALKKRLVEHPDAADAACRSEFLRESLVLWKRIGRRLLENPENRSNWTLYMNLAEAEIMSENWEEAEKIWAQVETLDPPLSPHERYQTLNRRAELLRTKLGDPAKALKLFRLARRLMDEISPTLPESHYDYIDKVIGELEAELKDAKH